MSQASTQPLRLLTTYCGRAWVVRFDNDKLREIRETIGLDLAAHIDDPGELARLLGSDIERYIPGIMTIVCADQLRERELSPDGFERLLLDFGSRYMVDSICAILQALGDHFPQSILARDIERGLDTHRQQKETR